MNAHAACATGANLPCVLQAPLARQFGVRTDQMGPVSCRGVTAKLRTTSHSQSPATGTLPETTPQAPFIIGGDSSAVMMVSRIHLAGVAPANPLDEAALHLNGAAHGVDHAAEFDEAGSHLLAPLSAVCSAAHAASRLCRALQVTAAKRWCSRPARPADRNPGRTGRVLFSRRSCRRRCRGLGGVHCLTRVDFARLRLQVIAGRAGRLRGGASHCPAMETTRPTSAGTCKALPSDGYVPSPRRRLCRCRRRGHSQRRSDLDPRDSRPHRPSASRRTRLIGRSAPLAHVVEASSRRTFAETTTGRRDLSYDTLARRSRAAG